MILVGAESLSAYYTTNFNLVKLHNFTISELENMIPYEREVYISLLEDYIKKEEERLNGK